MKILYVISIFIVFILIAGCTSVQPTVIETATPTPTQTSLVVVESNETPVYTVGPTPTTTEDLSRCYWHNTTEYPQYCYDRFYWVRPTYSPPGSGYTAKVWRNDSCTDLNRTSGECREWGDNTYVALFLHNLTIVRNVTGINNTELVAAVTYYNKTYDLNVINNVLSFSDFVNKYWDGTYPSKKYDTILFEPDQSVIIPIVNGSFNVDAF
jgi:hypothetical protein